jgi:hypothetical protein
MNVDIGTMLVHPKMIYFVFYRPTKSGPVHKVPVHSNKKVDSKSTLGHAVTLHRFPNWQGNAV